MPTLPTVPDTAGRILDVAERLVQTRGFNAFSYADIAAELNITKAALHYHFATKAILGERLVDRYVEKFFAALARINARYVNARARAKAYIEIYDGVLDRGRMCLCGMLAADFATLAAGVQDRVRRFFADNDAWLADMLTRGRERGELTFDGPPADAARFLVNALEGAMLLARSCGDAARFRITTARILSDLGAV